MSAQQRPPLACVYCRQITGHAPTCITYVAAELERVRQTQQPDEPHSCESCPTCGVHGGRHDKCCGCYDGVCCQELTDVES